MALGQQLPGMQHEIAQQTEFSSSQLHFFAVALHRLPAFIQLQAGRFQLRLVGQAMSAAQQGLDTQVQLLRVKGFTQVVIGARLEPFNTLGPGATCGKDQDRCGKATRAPFLQHLKPRFARQAEVENDQIIGFGRTLVGGITAIGQPVHRIALASQTGQQLVGQGYMVFNQQQAHSVVHLVLEHFAGAGM